MKRIEPMPGIEIAIFTFLVLGGTLLGAGIAMTAVVLIIMGVLFLALGTVALFGMLEAHKGR